MGFTDGLPYICTVNKRFCKVKKMGLERLKSVKK